MEILLQTFYFGPFMFCTLLRHQSNMFFFKKHHGHYSWPMLNITMDSGWWIYGKCHIVWRSETLRDGNKHGEACTPTKLVTLSWHLLVTVYQAIYCMNSLLTNYSPASFWHVCTKSHFLVHVWRPEQHNFILKYHTNLQLFKFE